MDGRGSSGSTSISGRETGYERCEEIVDWGIYRKEICEAFPNNGVRSGFKGSPKYFELVPYDPSNGSWGSLTTAVERRLHHGAEDWDRINLMGLDLEETRKLTWLGRGEPRRFFMAGGSDGHGDFNYRRSGALLGTTRVHDTAIGKPRNLVFAGRPPRKLGAFAPRGLRPHTQEQVVAALREGRFCVTDGPALRIAIERDGQDGIGDADLGMGGVHRIAGGKSNRSIKLHVEWKSTPEFGPVRKVDLYVGTTTSKNCRRIPTTQEVGGTLEFTRRAGMVRGTPSPTHRASRLALILPVTGPTRK